MARRMKRRSKIQQNRRRYSKAFNTRRIGGIESLEARELLAGDLGAASTSAAWHEYVPASILNDPEMVVSQPDADGNIRVIIETTAKQDNQTVQSALNAMSALNPLGDSNSSADNAKSLSQLPIVIAEVPVGRLDEISQLPNVRSVSVDYSMPPALDASVGVIGADVVHDNGTRGAGTTIAILDSGIDSTNDFFGTNGSRIVEERCFSNVSGANQSLCPNGQATDTNANVIIPACLDDDGDSICDHGTHVAGIAAGSASTDSSAPGDGVAPGANIIAIQVFHRENVNCGTRANGTPKPVPCIRTNNSDIIAGLNAVAAINVANPSLNIVSANMSLGGGEFESSCDNGDEARREIKTAIDSLLANGIATVVSAGNSGFNAAVSSPACISSAFTVGSTTNSDAISSFSNRGVLLDVFAPGSGIESAVAGGGYETFNGTSMAAPHVAGALAVLREDNPTRSITDLMNDLQVNGAPITYNSDGTNITTKRINVLGSLSGDSNDAMREATTIAVGDSNSSFTLSETYDVDMFKFSVTGGPQQIFIDVVERNNSNLDPFLRLFDEAGNELAADSNIGSASADLNVMLPDSGTYFVGVSSENNEDYDPITGFGDADGDASGAFTLTIGDNNDALSEAISLSVPQTQPGNIDLATDVDVFRFNAVAGTTYAFDVDRTDGSALDSFLRVFDAAGNQLAVDDDGESGDGPLPEAGFESYIEFMAPSTGQFFVGVSSTANRNYDVTDGSGDAGGGQTGGYTLTSFFPNAAGNDDENDQFHEANNRLIGSTSSTFTIDNNDDVDMFRIANVPAGQTLGFDVDNIIGSGLDAELRLWDENGNLLAQDDDSFGPTPEVSNLEPYIEYTFRDAGTYFVSVAAFDNNFYDPISGLFDSGSTLNLGQFTLTVTDENVVDPANQRIVTIADDIVAIDGETSLREAIAFVNNNSGSNTITFDASLSGQIIELSEGELLVNGPTIIDGPGADLLTIDANSQSRIFDVGLSGDLEVRDLTLTGGNANGHGGAILSEGAVTILRSRLVNNTAAGDGGAIRTGAFNTLTVTDSELSNNIANKGGAISLDAGTAFITTGVIENSTISGNSANDGGAIYAEGANMTIRNSTIAFNSSGIQSVANSSSNSAIVSDSIIAQNGLTDFDGEVRLFDSLLESDRDTTIDFIQSTEFLLDVDPRLAPLADNGGPTLTHALLLDSPAIGRATASGTTPAFDQRGSGFAREKVGQLDMGAFESGFEIFSGLVTIASDTVAVDGETSLREAINAAMNNASVSAVTFDPSLAGQTIVVDGGEMQIEDSVTISGLGADQLTIDLGGNSRLFTIDSGTDDIPDDLVDPTTFDEGATVVIQNVTLTGGFVPSTQSGGAINLNDTNDTLELDRIVISNSSGNAGGALRLAGNYVIKDSTLTGNTANFAGAALFATGSSNGMIVNSTISGNTSNSGAGAIQAQSNAYTKMQILNSTVADNSAAGINIFAYGGGLAEVTVTNSIFADNTGINVSNAGGSFVSSGHNLSDDGSAGFNGTGDLTNTNPQLGPLQNNGGTTPTHALLSGSTAINAGDPAFTGLAFDQRSNGFDRVVGGRVDIGSFEEQSVTTLACDFNADGSCDGDDIDQLQAAIVDGIFNPTLDLIPDGDLNINDRDRWLELAGSENIGPGAVYLLGDANLDGSVDGQDFVAWNGNKFTSTAAWTDGDFNADGFVNGQDFVLWNSNKFQEADSLTTSAEEKHGDEQDELQVFDLVFAALG